MLAITTKRTDFAGKIKRVFSGCISKSAAKISEAVHTIRFAMLASYMAVTVVVLLLMSAYITGILSENLYSEKTIQLYSKANVISQSIGNVYQPDDDNLAYLRYEDIVERSLAGTNIRGVVTDTSYKVYYDTNNESEMIGKVFMRNVLKRALDGEQAQSVFDADRGKTITVSVPIERNGEIIGGVYLAENVSAINDTITTIQNSLIVFCILIILIIGILSVVISFTLTQPITEFMGITRAISRGDFTKRAKITGMGEMAQMAKTLNYMCAELNALDEKRRKFVSDVSHELKTPMAGIKLLCDSLLSVDNVDKDTLREFLTDMSEEIDRLTRLVNRLLVLTKLDAGENLSLSEVDINALVMTVIKKLMGLAGDKNIQLLYNVDEVSERPITADYDKIYEAIYNIVDNAIKYTPDNGIVNIKLREEDDFYVIDIEDTGEGIPDSEKQNVFERFYRIDDSRARETGGTGLGLAIAKEAIVLHSGSVEIFDGAGGGSIFRIKLPIMKRSR